MASFPRQSFLETFPPNKDREIGQRPSAPAGRRLQLVARLAYSRPAGAPFHDEHASISTDYILLPKMPFFREGSRLKIR
jgi:hypothetical protein